MTNASAAQQAPPVSPVSATPRVAPSTDFTAVLALLRLEGETRNAKSLDDLIAIMANETRKLTRAQQIFVFEAHVGRHLKIVGASGMGKPDLGTPLLQSIGAMITVLQKEHALTTIREFALDADAPGASAVIAQYPFRSALWLPVLGRNGRVLAGLLLVRTEPWKQSEITLAQRLSQAYAQAWYWLSTSRSPWHLIAFDKRRVAIGLAVAAVIGLLPTSMTSLAPMEVVPRAPEVVAAPLDGVIDDIPVSAGQTVAAGDVLVRFADTVLRNRLEVAEREAQVALSRVKKTTLLAVTEMRGRHELALARAEYAVKLAEQTYAREMMGRAVVRAAKAGVVILGNKRDLIGKPASTGERIMELGDPAQIEVRIDVPVGDAIVLGKDRHAKIFLDSRPLDPVMATVTTSGYQARPVEGGALAYQVMATWPNDVPPPRLGLRGTAQLYGDRVPMIWTLLRRPVSAFRQWVGL